MIFGSKKNITRKEHIGYYTVVEYKGKTQIYYCGAYVNTKNDPFDDIVNLLKKEVQR
jgi:hypothetical protein